MMAGTLIKGKRIEGRPWLKDEECYTYKKRNEYKKSKFSTMCVKVWKSIVLVIWQFLSCLTPMLCKIRFLDRVAYYTCSDAKEFGCQVVVNYKWVFLFVNTDLLLCLVQCGGSGSVDSGSFPWIPDLYKKNGWIRIRIKWHGSGSNWSY